MDYNPREIIGIPVVGFPIIRIGQTRMINLFGETDNAYIIEDTDQPWLLWEDGKPISWEDRNNILLEQQKVRIWLRKGRR